MAPRLQLDEARAVGREVTERRIEDLRGQARIQVRRSMGMTGAPPPACDDPALAYIAPGSVVRRIHGDLPAMLIGGVSALLFQMLHPLAMAGVAQHSNYRSDPFGRLERTASFLTTTTFGTEDEARDAIGRVRRVHARVTGTARDGRRYSASDPDLLTWVHAAEVSSFLAASRVYAPVHPDPGRGGRLPRPDGRVAADLGAVDMPRSMRRTRRATSPGSDPGSASPPRPAPPATSSSAGWAGGPTRSPPTGPGGRRPGGAAAVGPPPAPAPGASRPSTGWPCVPRPGCWAPPSGGW